MKTTGCATTQGRDKTLSSGGWGGLSYESSTTNISSDTRRFGQIRQPWQDAEGDWSMIQVVQDYSISWDATAQLADKLLPMYRWGA